MEFYATAVAVVIFFCISNQVIQIQGWIDIKEQCIFIRQ